MKIGPPGIVHAGMASTVPLLTPALAEYIRGRLAQTPDATGTVQVGNSPRDCRHANRASELELVKQYTYSRAPTLTHGTFLLVLPAARSELKRYDQRQLPSGVKVSTSNAVTYQGKHIGEIRRGGAGRGGEVVWSAYTGPNDMAHVGDWRADRIAAARAICKHNGIELPGEEA